MAPAELTVDRVLQEVDVVIIGVGLSGAIIASELSQAGLSVVGLERGPWREPTDPEYTDKHDELRFRVRQEMLQDAALETFTFRHHDREDALPMRYLGAFCPASGVGGSSIHYGGIVTRFVPWEFEMRSRTIERYGPSAIPEGSTIADWGLTYEQLEPSYDKFERAVGVSGKAGNVNGTIVQGGNPFEGPRSREFPLAPLKLPAGPALVAEGARSLGYHPYPTPAAILSEPYTNPAGISRQACTYCGQCVWHACAVGAKGDSNVVFVPTALQSGRFELRPDSYVAEVTHDSGRARAVRYYDASGDLVEQPAEIIVICAYALNSVRLLLLSGLGEPYDPRTQTGTVGKNYAYQTIAPSLGFFKDRKFKNYMGMGLGILADDFANDNFDHSGVGFIGGAQLGSQPVPSLVDGPPLPPGSPRWGVGWKQAMHDWYDRVLLATAVGHSLSYRSNYLDLDPTYTDAWGLPLLRITFDWFENEHLLTRFASERIAEILRCMDADEVLTTPLSDHFNTVVYQSTHNTGGAIMGPDPSSSAVNTHLQMWDVENVWVVGGSALPQNGTPGPTGTIGALAFRAAEAILRYCGSS